MSFLKTLLSHRVHTVSNWMSFSRIIIAPFVSVFLLYEGMEFVVIGLIILLALTDFLDGFFARRFHQKTLLGRVLDPLADKLAILFILIPLTIIQSLYMKPLYFGLIILIVARDFLSVMLGIQLMRKKDVIPSSNILGKISVGILTVTFFWLILVDHTDFLPALSAVQKDMLGSSFAIASYGMILFSSIVYVFKYFIRSHKKTRNNN